MKKNLGEIFSIGVTNQNQIKIETPDTEDPILLNLANAEELSKMLGLFITVLKEESEDSKHSKEF